MTEKDLLIENLRHLADGVVAMFGKNCEACVHDLTSLQHSLVYIRGDVTRRKTGAPATDLLIKLLKQMDGRGGDLHNYKTTAADGRALKSTTTLVRDSSGTPVAAFCINFDTTAYYNASQALMPFIYSAEGEAPSNLQETFAHSLPETVEALFGQGVDEIAKHPTTMSVEEKTHLISILEANGTFQLKGAVEQIAQLMGVTKYTVYNYLKKVRNTPQPHK